MDIKLPNFLIVGAAKCGTSSLHNYLNQHPDIFMPSYTRDGLKVKEPRFLIAEEIRNRLPKGIWDLDSYKSLFKNVDCQQAIGESTVLYLYFYKTAIKNIKKYLAPDVRIIIMLRNPIERAYSAYSFASRSHQENQNFKDALKNARKRFEKDANMSPMILYKDLGLYFKMVKAYIENFHNVHIVIYDDFILNTDLEVRRVLDFLQVSNQHKIDTNKIINRGGKKWDSRLAKDWLMSEGWVKLVVKFLLPEKIRIRIKNFLINTFTSKAPEMDRSIKIELLEYYTKDIRLLEKLINKDLSQWLKI